MLEIIGAIVLGYLLLPFLPLLVWLMIALAWLAVVIGIGYGVYSVVGLGGLSILLLLLFLFNGKQKGRA